MYIYIYTVYTYTISKRIFFSVIGLDLPYRAGHCHHHTYYIIQIYIYLLNIHTIHITYISVADPGGRGACYILAPKWVKLG